MTGPDPGRWGGPGLWKILVPAEMVEAMHSIPSFQLPNPSQGGLGPKDPGAQTWVGEGWLAAGRKAFGEDYR